MINDKSSQFACWLRQLRKLAFIALWERHERGKNMQNFNSKLLHWVIFTDLPKRVVQRPKPVDMSVLVGERHGSATCQSSLAGLWESLRLQVFVILQILVSLCYFCAFPRNAIKACFGLAKPAKATQVQSYEGGIKQ